MLGGGGLHGVDDRGPVGARPAGDGDEIVDAEDLHHHINTVDTPLNQLGTRDLCPGSVALERINASLR